MDKNLRNELIKEEEILLKSEFSDEFKSASTFFGMYSKYFTALVKGLSTGQLRRLVNALVQYPLNDKEFINEDQNLKDAFSIGERMIQCKFLMIQEHVAKQMEKGNKDDDASKEENS